MWLLPLVIIIIMSCNGAISTMREARFVPLPCWTGNHLCLGGFTILREVREQGPSVPRLLQQSQESQHLSPNLSVPRAPPHTGPLWWPAGSIMGLLDRKPWPRAEMTRVHQSSSPALRLIRQITCWGGRRRIREKNSVQCFMSSLLTHLQQCTVSCATHLNLI